MVDSANEDIDILAVNPKNNVLYGITPKESGNDFVRVVMFPTINSGNATTAFAGRFEIGADAEKVTAFEIVEISGEVVGFIATFDSNANEINKARFQIGADGTISNFQGIGSSSSASAPDEHAFFEFKGEVFVVIEDDVFRMAPITGTLTLIDDSEGSSGQVPFDSTGEFVSHMTRRPGTQEVWGIKSAEDLNKPTELYIHRFEFNQTALSFDGTMNLEVETVQVDNTFKSFISLAFPARLTTVFEDTFETG